MPVIIIKENILSIIAIVIVIAAIKVDTTNVIIIHAIISSIIPIFSFIVIF